MVHKVFSAALIGIDAEIIEVEADCFNGLPATNIVGLPDTAVKESRERVKSAIKNSGGEYPQTRVSVNLAPADVPKNGSHFDLPIALSILLASGGIGFETKKKMFVGELALDGSLRPIPGVLAMARKAKQSGFTEIFVPVKNADEATLVPGLQVYAFENLISVVNHLLGLALNKPSVGSKAKGNKTKFQVDFGDIVGQALAKRALTIAASGGHNVLFSGPPGSGKTMLAKAIVSILPPLSPEETLEVSTIYSVSGLLRDGLVRTRPIRSPHHTTSNIALIGGGANAKPGEITLAHKGVLFLDEFPEFPRNVLESLRQPLEDGVVTVSRAKSTHRYPADFILVASQNPCPCGYFGDKEKECLCTQSAINKYQKKISGPLLDRIDMFVNVGRVSFSEMNKEREDLNSESLVVRELVVKTRNIQGKRLGKDITNSLLSPKDIAKFCKLDESSSQMLEEASNHFHFSPRQIHRLLKISRTIADLSGSGNIQKEHLAEAIQYRVNNES